MSKVAMLMTKDFEDSEASQPLSALQKAGYQVDIISGKEGEELAGKQGKTILRSHLAVDQARASDYAALVIPGGHSPEQLRAIDSAVDFVRDFAKTGRPIAAVCHGPQLLISADLVKGRKMTCFKTIAVDLINAGASYEDKELVIDGQFITSRQPSDLPDFCHALVEALHANHAKIS
jgi:protease I